jgi:hypothetical protein
MFVFTDPQKATEVKAGVELLGPGHGRIFSKSEADDMTRLYFERMEKIGQLVEGNPDIKFNIDLEPIALVYDRHWFIDMLEQDPKPALIRLYFGFFEGRHTILFIGADEQGNDMPSSTGDFFIVEDGTVCCPKAAEINGCGRQLSLFIIK